MLSAPCRIAGKPNDVCQSMFVSKDFAKTLLTRTAESTGFWITQVCGAFTSLSVIENVFVQLKPPMRIGVSNREVVCRSLCLLATESLTPWELTKYLNGNSLPWSMFSC